MKRTWLLLTLLCALCGADVCADDRVSLENALSSASTVDGSDLDRPAELHMPVRLDLPSYAAVATPERSFLQQVTYDHRSRVPGSVVIKYDGFQGFVMKHLQRRYSSTWRKQIRELEKETFITDQELDQMWQRRAELTMDHEAGGRWWERDWFHSLPPEKGGIWKGAYVHQVGKTVPIFTLGAFSINNEFRGRYRKVTINLVDGDAGRVYRDPDSAPASRDDAHLEREMVLDPEDLEALETPHRRTAHQLPTSADLWIGLQPQSGRFFDGLSWRFKVRPKAKLRLRTENSTVNFRLRGELEVFLGVKTKRKVAVVRAEVRYRPEDEEVMGLVSFALVAW